MAEDRYEVISKIGEYLQSCCTEFRRLFANFMQQAKAPLELSTRSSGKQMAW
jgi:hypothetical protein